MKRIIVWLSVLCLAACMLTGCGKDDSTGDETTKKSNTTDENKDTDEEKDAADQKENGKDSVLTEENMEEVLSGKHHVEIVIKDQGTIKAELDADQAPVTVTNFINLAQEGFYDGLTFHRIIDGFMMQGGDPLGNGTGGAGNDIKGEFSSNGVENTISHVRGTLSMARASEPDSGSSQFFIVQQDSTYLDGEYAAFGTVTEGMEIVDSICENAEVTDQNGTVKSGTQPVIETIRVID